MGLSNSERIRRIKDNLGMRKHELGIVIHYSGNPMVISKNPWCGEDSWAGQTFLIGGPEGIEMRALAKVNLERRIAELEEELSNLGVDTEDEE